MMTRRISDDPSQIRSTRTSRYNGEIGIDHKEARRLLHPAQVNRADRLARAMALFGCAATVTIERRPVRAV